MRLWLGGLLVAIGVFGLLDVLDVVDWESTAGRWWPVAVIALGLLTMASERRISFGSGAVTVIGLLLLGGRMDWLDGRIVFPLLLVFVGLAILFRSFGRNVRSSSGEGNPHSLVMFGGGEIKDRSEHFEYADVSAVFGGATLDLRGAHIDKDASVDATAVFGGVDVLVPEGWRVTMRGIPIFGAYEDKTGNGTALSNEAPTLHINATSVFGAVEVAHEPS